MFHNLSTAMKQRMQYLEAIDQKDRADGTARLQRLRQIPPETGKFIALIAANCPTGQFIEIGTSAGYSTLWLTLACMERNTKIKTFEIDAAKARMAQETFDRAGVLEYTDLVEGDALDYLETVANISFCLLDAEKEIYDSCYDLIIPRLVEEGILIADNAINHYAALKAVIEKALHDGRIDAMVVPIGKGELICRKKVAGPW